MKGSGECEVKEKKSDLKEEHKKEGRNKCYKREGARDRRWTEEKERSREREKEVTTSN